jgi:L-ascorbate metabolism protein UlaG (beta-lactamase superfamily)
MIPELGCDPTLIVQRRWENATSMIELDVCLRFIHVRLMIVPKLQGEALVSDIANTVDDEEHLHVWWLGQSGFLLKHHETRVLIDPYLSDSLTLKYAQTDKPHVRMTEICMQPQFLQDLDVIASSHLHTDHFDVVTLVPLFSANSSAQFFYPAAERGAVVERLGGHFPPSAIGLSDGDSIQGEGFEIQGIVAAHNEVDRDELGQSRYLGFWIRLGPFRIYHSGDTLWNDDIIKQVRERGCDLALVPINGNRPERRVAGNLNGTEAAALAKALGVRMAVPHHFEMFEFNTDSPDEFLTACGRLGQSCKVLKCGERLTLLASDFLPG